jgi:hypothetical protein
MDNNFNSSKFIPINKDIVSSDIINKSVFAKINYVDPMQKISDDLAKSRDEQMKQITKFSEEKRQRDDEQRKNLQRIADNSEETTITLKEQNEILKDSNAALKEANVLLKDQNISINEKLTGIQRNLNDLFNLGELQYDNNTEIMQEVFKLVSQIEIDVRKNGKYDFKKLLAEQTPTVITALLQYLIQGISNGTIKF